ncbi:MAG: hypothetical protein COS34_06700 [Lysobacterales bacterium CG02_land_8_20_14_3_00_62_12]|nr:MAG: hypothetical protein COS34_06700 [Xanthomonadales bacterium CG02_land_8_20_14_3_00_62_12]
MAKMERTETTVDTLTGVVLSAKSNVISLRPLDDEPAYLKMYIEDLGLLLKIQNAHRSILLRIASFLDYDGLVALTTTRRVRIAMSCNVSEKTVRNAITALIAEGIMKRVGRAEYEMNPHLFARGAWVEIRGRREAFKVELIYSADGRRQIRTQRMSAAEAARNQLEGNLGQQSLPLPLV